MEPVLHPSEMRRADEATIASGVPGATLMNRAAYACATVALDRMRGGYGRRVVAVCGKGNNGGDGIAAVRHLSRAGVRGTVLLLADPVGDAAVHAELLRTASGVRVLPWSQAAFDAAVRRASVVVDGVFGTGFDGRPSGPAEEAISAMDRSGRDVLAVDIPSGVSAADGSVAGVSVRADVTVAIQALKLGHVLAPGALRCGRVDVAEVGIGLPPASVHVPTAVDVAGVLPALEPDTHKYRVGAAAVLAGSPGMTGAAILTAVGAQRAGAGMVVVGVPQSCLGPVEERVVEAVKVGLPSTDGAMGEKAFEEFSERLQRCRSLAVGPGIGRSPHAVALVRRALEVDLPVVVDADGLWALAEILGSTPEALRERTQPTVLTPHAGEFERLGGRGGLDGVREAAAGWGAIVHLKGRRALTALPDGNVYVNTTGNPGVATAGSGDVLTGVIAALCARGTDPAVATWAGAWVHGAAGDAAAARLGRAALGAADLADAIPTALRRLAAQGLPQPGGRAVRTVVEAP